MTLICDLEKPTFVSLDLPAVSNEFLMIITTILRMILIA